MSLKVLHRSEINYEKWNERIAANHADIYNDANYLDSVCFKNWYGFIWGNYEKVLPFYRKRKWGVVPYICMPPFCQKFDNSTLTVSEWEEALTYLKKHNVRVDIRVLDNKGDSDFQEKTNYVLDKSECSPDEIKDSYSSLLRKNIHKADVNLDITSESFSTVHPFLLQNPLFKTLVIEKFNPSFLRLIDMIPIEILAAKKKKTNEIIAVLISVRNHGKSYLIFPYTNEEGKKWQAVSGLIHHHIVNSNNHFIDFEGSSIESIAQFYAQFGAKKEVYWSLNWKKRFFRD